MRRLAGALALAAILAAPAIAGEVATAKRAEPFLAPTILAELADETRPVARTVARGDDGTARVAAGPVRVPPGAELEAWFGVAGTAEGPGTPGEGWRFELVARGEDTSDRAASRSVSGAGARWGELRLDVGALAGEEVTVELVATPVSEDAPGRPVLGAPRFVVREPAGSARRNVILVSLDTVRADRLSSYGAERPTTPEIDARAAEGVRFATALAPASSTPPSHMTMLTGTLPCRHGVWGTHVEDDLPEEIETLAEVLRRDGYTTVAVTENAYVAAPYGFARGFDSYVELKQMTADRNSPAPGVVTPTGYAPKTFAEAGSWLRENADRRFFLFLHTYQAHGPRRPTGKYADLFPEAGDAAGDREGFDPEFHDLRRYDQLVRQLDDLVGALVRDVVALGLAGETVVILTSDHGEAFFEHGDHGHGFSVYGEVLRVPLVIWAPGLAAPGVVEGTVGLVDLVPTVLDLLRLPVPDGLDGTSLAGAVRQPGAAPAARGPYYAETAPGNVRAIRDDRFKIVRGEDRASDVLFDLASDAAETQPIELGGGPLPEPLTRHADEIASLRAELDRRAAQCRDQRRRADAARGSAGKPDPERRRKLEALGYLE